MNIKTSSRQFLFSLMLAAVCLLPLQATENAMWFFVIVKSNNYAQDQSGKLSLLNYHFFSELFGREHGNIESATLKRNGSDLAPFVYEDRGETFYYEGGHFNTLQAVDAAHANGDYDIVINLASGKKVQARLKLEGPQGKTDIPAPIAISFYQQGKAVAQNEVEPDLDLKVQWSPYSNGQADVRGIVDDMIFVVFQNCQGERIFHTGLPFKEDNYTRYNVPAVTVPAGSFKAGKTYSLFVEFPHVVDSVVVEGIPGFSSYATATYTDITTSGEMDMGDCPEKIPPLDTGQTDRMEVEIHK